MLFSQAGPYFRPDRNVMMSILLRSPKVQMLECICFSD